jgi:hypothetical protein
MLRRLEGSLLSLALNQIYLAISTERLGHERTAWAGRLKAAVDVEGPSGIERVSIGVRTGREILVLYRT